MDDPETRVLLYAELLYTEAHMIGEPDLWVETHWATFDRLSPAHEIFRLTGRGGERQVIKSYIYPSEGPDAARITVGGLAEAHATLVDDIRAGRPPWWERAEDTGQGAQEEGA